MKKAEMKKKLKEITANKRVRFVTKIVLLSLVGLIAFRLFLLVFPIRHFDIGRDTLYDVNDIVNASGIRSGKPLYAINKRKAEKKIIEECPHVKSVRIKQKFPNTVYFEIEESVAGWYIQVGDDFYALDYDLKVIVETYQEETMKERGLTKLVLPELETVIIGEVPKFGSDDEQLVEETLTIIHTIRTNDIKENMDALDLSNRFEIKMTVYEKFDVNFGDMNDAETKFDMITRIVAKSKESGYAGGEINVIDPLASSFRGYFESASTDIETTETNKREDE